MKPQSFQKLQANVPYLFPRGIILIVLDSKESALCPYGNTIFIFLGFWLKKFLENIAPNISYQWFCSEDVQNQKRLMRNFPIGVTFVLKG